MRAGALRRNRRLLAEIRWRCRLAAMIRHPSIRWEPEASLGHARCKPEVDGATRNTKIPLR